MVGTPLDLSICTDENQFFRAGQFNKWEAPVVASTENSRVLGTVPGVYSTLYTKKYGKFHLLRSSLSCVCQSVIRDLKIWLLQTMGGK